MEGLPFILTPVYREDPWPLTHDVMSLRTFLDHNAQRPVMYLRSFQDDATTAKVLQTTAQVPTGPYTVVTVPLPPSLQRTEEKTLEEALKEIGPYVALSRSREKVQTEDVSRVYVYPPNWREEVGKLMPKAQLVVIRLGMTKELCMSEGLHWEVETAIEHVEPKRLVLLVPWEKNLYEVFRSEHAKLFPAGLPKYGVRGSSRIIGSLHGIIHFAPDWTPHFLHFKQYDKDNIALKRTLIPVFQQLGFSCKRKFLSYDFSIRKPE